MGRTETALNAGLMKVQLLPDTPSLEGAVFYILLYILAAVSIGGLWFLGLLLLAGVADHEPPCTCDLISCQRCHPDEY